MDKGWRLAIDIGGTFTDIVLLEPSSGRVVVAKTLTTTADPLRGVKAGCRQAWDKAGVEPNAVIGAVVHATTLVTNALIEGKGAPAALVTTQGFADTLLIRNEHRYDMYDLQIEFPEPPIPRERTFELEERTLADGRILTEPTTEGMTELGRQLADDGIDAVAVCLLHSYANPANERQVAMQLKEHINAAVCISADVAPQIREYSRMTTTACNAVAMPLVDHYLEEFQQWLRERDSGSALLIMLSNGGVVAASDAARTPIRMVESGPAAGALATAWYARRMSEEHVLSFDMGGTTAKACLIEDFEPSLSSDFEVARVYRFKKGSGFPVTVPSVDLVEIGAGGGSIARVDALGLLKVGPESTGAVPGPACYGNGGEQPTVTDADLLLGYLDPDHFLGGDMALDSAAARTAFVPLADTLGLEVIDAAAGVHELVNQNMAAAARMHGIERGADLRGVPMVAFGGAGPVHACGVAELLEVDRVLFPLDASVLSAFGTLVTPARVDLARSFVVRMDAVSDEDRERLLDDMRSEAHATLQSAGVEEADVTFRYGIDARYVGQGNEVTVWLGEGAHWPMSPDAVLEHFASHYQAIYGLSIPDVPVEVVTWRLSAFAPTPDVNILGAHGVGDESAQKGTRHSYFQRGTAGVETAVYDRNRLGVGVSVAGPALIEERETTIVLRAGWTANVLNDGSIIATREVF